MDTFEAREVMRNLGRRGFEVVRGFINGESSALDSAGRMRESIDEARSVLADAGYPAEAVWRSLQEAQAMFVSPAGSYEPAAWTDLADDIARAVETLDGLLSQPTGHNSDFRIIG